MSTITESDLERMLLDEAAEPLAIPFDLLAKITNMFSDELEIGRGGFAIVYKAMLKNGGVAVKRLLSNSYLYEIEFQREIKCLMKIKHANIVRFLGYCADIQRSVGSYNGEFVMTDLEHRLLCFQYLPKGSLHDYIKDASGGLEWRQRYKIIKGICAGLCYLHKNNILHLDLKPANILLDENMLPKITDFGMSRFLEKDQTRFDATKVGGTMGYLPPEYTSHVITPKFDLYSFGVVMLEILTGKKGYQAIDDVLESWSNRLNISQGSPEWEQIKVCTEIGMQCTKFNPAKRPRNMKDIMDRLVGTEGDENAPATGVPVQTPKERASREDAWSLRMREKYCNELHLLEHDFCPQLGESIPCSLHLTNKRDEHVAFRLMKRNSSSLCSYPTVHKLFGVMSPRSSCTLIMTETENNLVEETGVDLVLQSSICRYKNKDQLDYNFICNELFDEAKDLGHAVYEVAVKDIYSFRPGETTFEAFRSTIVIEPTCDTVYSLDAHPMEPWIVIGGWAGSVSVWNHESKTTMASFQISEESGPVGCVKFHATKKWIIVWTLDQLLHVYDCACVTKIQKITSFRFHSDMFGIHPTKPYLVSTNKEIWDWDKGWQCIRKDEKGIFHQQLEFNPEDPNILASTLWNEKYIEVWSLDSSKTVYTLEGHSDYVNCLEFFKHGDRQCLITGSRDCTAKIWDMQTKACIHTIDVFMTAVNYVISIPGRPYLVTCTHDATIHVWSSTDFRLKKTFNSRAYGSVIGLVCLMGSRRITIGQLDGVITMDIDDDEEAVASEGNNATGQSSNP